MSVTLAIAPVVGRASFPDSAGIAGASLVQVGMDQTVAGVAIAFPSTPLARVHGTIIDGAGQPFRGSVALGLSSRSGVAEADARRTQVIHGTFAFTNVSPCDYVVKATAATESGFAIREPGFSRSESGAVVVTYPTGSRRWFDRSPYLRLAPVDRSGRFTLAGLPPGDYLIAAIDAADINPLSDE